MSLNVLSRFSIVMISWLNHGKKLLLRVPKALRLNIKGLKPKYQPAIKAGWYEIEGKKYYFRSGWEQKYALYLQSLKKAKLIFDWQYEPAIFWFKGLLRGTNNYKPDFKVIRNDGTHYWVEVKGYMDAKSQTKINRMRKYYPEEELHVVSSEFFHQGYKRQITPALRVGINQNE